MSLRKEGLFEFMSEFDRWNEIKKEIDKKEKLPHFHEREIWFISVGENIGIEQNGKGEKFLRPVLIIKKFNKEQFLGVMLTSKCKDSKFLFKIKENSCVNLSQIRVFSAKRLLRLKSKLKLFKFEEIISKLFEITLPKKGGLGLKVSKSNDIISQNKNNVNLDKWNESKKEGILKFCKQEELLPKHGESGLMSNFANVLPPSKDGVCLTANSCKAIIPQRDKNVKTIWFDLVTPKSVLFFSPIIKEIQKKCNALITTRGGEGYKETTELLDLYEFNYHCIGNFGGGELKDKLHASISRQFQFFDLLSHQEILKLVCLSSVDAVRVAFGLGIPVYNFYDIPLSDHKTNFKKALPQARLTIPLATKMFKPFVVPDEVIKSRLLSMAL